MRVTSTKPQKYTTVEHYALHRATVTVRNATARELEACAEVAKRHPWAQRNPYDPSVWEVRQRYEGKPSCLGGADFSAVDTAREELADEMRRA